MLIWLHLIRQHDRDDFGSATFCSASIYNLICGFAKQLKMIFLNDSSTRMHLLWAFECWHGG